MTDRRDLMLRDMSELLVATGCADVPELQDLVDGDCDPDMWVYDIDGGVEVGSGTSATCLEFPFTLAGFWALVDEVEGEEVVRIKCLGVG